MPNTLAITVEEPDKILNTGAYGTGALIRLQTAATEAGAYADVTGAGSTPTITVVTGTRSYDGYDPAGTVASWYRTRYENVAGTRLSDWSDSFQVSPEGSGLICSLWDVKQALGISGSGDDEDIIEHIRQVTATIHNVTGRLFVRSPANGTITYTFDVRTYSRVLRVPKGIAECSQVEVATQTGGSYAVVPTDDWYLDPPEQDRDAGWPATYITLSDHPTGGVAYFHPGKRTVRLTMALGFATVPADVQGVGIRAAIASYLSKGSGTGGLATVGPSGEMRILRHISPSDMGILARYAVIP